MSDRNAAAESFRCQIQRCSTHAAVGRVVQLAARAEIHQHHAIVVRDHHVLRFDVAVEQSGCVHRGDGTTQVDADPFDLLC